MNDQLTSRDELTLEIVESGVVTFEDLVRCVQRFHYGRNANRSNLSLVWYERKGTCSSKHAFLKMIADLNDIPSVDLILCIYRMNDRNTPGVGEVLKSADLDFIPEAHCFLKINGQERDLTFMHSSIEKLTKDIVHHECIQPTDIVERKIEIHQEFMRKWMREDKIQHSFNELWRIRECCIAELEKKRE